MNAYFMVKTQACNHTVRADDNAKGDPVTLTGPFGVWMPLSFDCAKVGFLVFEGYSICVACQDVRLFTSYRALVAQDSAAATTSVLPRRNLSSFTGVRHPNLYKRNIF